MDSLAPPETLTPDPLLTENPGLVPETLAQTEGNAVGNTPFTAGTFVWAKVKGQPWWPALVSSQLKKDSVLVACFGNEERLAWCQPKQLKPFFKVFDEMSRQSRSKSFLSALHGCLQEVERSLELALACSCVPAEARPNPLRGEGGGEIPVARLSPKEFRERIMDVSRNVRAVDVLEAARLRSWVFGFGKVSMQGDSWEFCRRRGIDDLVDKIDLDALPVEMVGGKDEAEEGLAVDSSAGKRRRRSMSKLIAEMDLDLEDLDDDDDDNDEEDDEDKEEKSLRSMKRRGRGKLEAVKAEEEAGSSSGRRERKKSKYLSPPYTNLREVGKFLAMLPRKNSSSSDHGVTTGPSACQDDEEDDDNKSSLLKIQRMPTVELLSELLSTAENPLHLKGNRGAKIIKFFFAMYRDSKYSDGADFGDYQKIELESTAKTEDSVEDSGKHELAGSSSKDLEVKQQKSNSKPGVDTEAKLDSVPPKRNRRNVDDLDSKPQRNSDLEKQKPRRKKLLKDQISHGAPIFLDFCNANSLDAAKGKKKKKKSTNIMDGSLQEAQVDSDPNLSNASFHGKEKQKLRRRKRLNDATSKEIPANLDLNMADLSGESKLEQCNKRSKSDADDDSTMAVDPQIDGDLENVVGLDVEPLNYQKLVLVDEKRVGNKEGANGKAIQKLLCADARFSELGKSILKKKNASTQPKAKSGRRKVKGVDHPIFPREAALHLTFHSGATLPSTEDLIAAYSKYGDLIRSQPVELFEESNSARVLFAKDADAESAFKDKAGPFGSVATLRLHLSGIAADHGQSNHETASSSLQISDAISPVKSESAPAKPALPYIRKSLETMISTLAWSSSSPVNSVGSTSDGLKPEARENLVGEMQGLLQKVEKMLNGAGSSS
ncbi:hypothetical protein KSP39_PZI010853 [Platanthera zijinensis]|uniref:PWWP domain-containing protein n=1 Tax=Platanthera zijinensis TaxID=2320716 RepID=A0AAP0G5L1_9ASPA